MKSESSSILSFSAVSNRYYTSPLQPLCSTGVSTIFIEDLPLQISLNWQLSELTHSQVDTFRRIKFLVFDAKSLDGMDASGAMSMLKLSRKAAAFFDPWIR